MFRCTSVCPAQSLRKSLLVPGLRSLGWLLLAAMGILVLVLAAGIAVRPDLWRAGPRFLGKAIGIGLGTGAGTLIPVVAGGLAFSLGRRISPGWELLGLGRLRMWLGLWPLWALCILLGAGMTLVAEPASWARVGEVRGVPLAAKVAWERLDAGAVLTTGDGGWLRRAAGGGLEFRSGEGALEFRTATVEPEATTSSWGLSGFEASLDGPYAGQWSADKLTVSLRPAARQRYQASSSSPWARSMPELAHLRSESDRAARVWFRRWLQLSSIPMLSLGLWCVALPRSPRRRRFLPPSVLALSILFFFFLFLRLAEDFFPPSFVLLLPLALLAWLISWGLRR